LTVSQTTSINDLQADSRGFKAQFTTYKDTVDRHNTDISTLQRDSKSLSSNFDSMDSDNKTNQHNIGELQQSAKDFSSTLIKVKDSLSTIGTPNLVSAYNWTTLSDGYWSPVKTVTHPFYNGSQPLYVINNQTSNENYACSPRFNLKPNTTYVVSLIGFEDVHVSNSDIFVLARKAGETASFTIAYNTIPGTVFSSTKAQYVASSSFTTGDDVDSGYMRIDNNGSKDGNNGGLFFTEVKLQEGTIATPYTSAQEDLATVTEVSSISQTIDKIQGTIANKSDKSQVTQLADQLTSKISGLSSSTSSQITQLKDDISLRVEKAGVISAIDVSNEGIQIYGNKLHITATTYIDDTIIKSAMIESLKADKIRTGTLDADKVQVINLNADNITAGTIRGANLTIGLNSGNVEFQAGRIHSPDNSIDININNKYMSVADKDNRILISGGEIQMIQPTLFSRQDTPYVRISNAGAGSSFGGATFWGRDYFVVTNGANDGSIFSSPLGEEEFAGISGGHSTLGWQVTKIGGAERGVFISGGKAYNSGTLSCSPFIKVGDDGSSGSGMRGSNITIFGDFVHIKSPHTTSSSANVHLDSDGTLLKSTSAAKYKTDIVRSFETEMGNKLLEVPVAHWKDKEEVLAKTRDSNAKDPETYFGMIADDLDEAGLNELVEYDDKGAVNGIQYDRVSLALIPLIRNYRDRITKLETKVKQMKEV